jgi:hypothetical protein
MTCVDAVKVRTVLLSGPLSTETSRFPVANEKRPVCRKERTIPRDPKDWRPTLSVLIRFSPESLTAEQYDEVVRRLTETGVFPAKGLDYEVCFGSEGNLKVSQVWDTQEQLDAFGAKLMPILAELNIEPGQPEVVEVHNIIKQ